MKTLIRFTALFMACGVASIGWQAQAANKSLEFTVVRDGATIGSHSYTISDHDGETLVEVATDIKIKVLFVTTYKFIHTSKEVWKNGRLVLLNSTTDDDGTSKSLTVQAQTAKLTVNSVVQGQDRRQNASAEMLPASLWKQDMVKQSALLNTFDGTVMNISVEDLGRDEVKAHGANVTAHHYAISGELTRELWFNGAGDLVRMRFPDKTGTAIIYTLK